MFLLRIITHLAYRVNVKKGVIHNFESARNEPATSVICYWTMTQFMALDGVTSFLRLKDVTKTRKRVRRILSIGGSSSVQWRKVERSGSFQICFHPSLCVRIEIDQLMSVNC